MQAKITVLSTADFNSNVWTNKQYLAVGLASRTHVTYVESMGLRAPTVSRADLQRIVQRLKGAMPDRGNSALPPHLSVISPKVVPFHGIRWVQDLNRQLVQRHLVPRVGPGVKDILWTFSPLTYGLESHYAKVVYHSVDLLHTLPGVPAAELLRAEAELVRRADHVVASSSGVASHLATLGAKPLLWENVADVETFSRNRSNGPRDGVIFAGNITPTKVDFSLLIQIAERGMRLTLAGPVSIDGVAADRLLDNLLGHPNVNHVGNLGIEALAELFGRHKVGIIPYNVNDYTSGVFPLKVYEYLAAGLSVVSTPIGSLLDARPEGVIFADLDDFGATVALSLSDWAAERGESNYQLALGHSWSDRIEQAWALIEGRAEDD